MRSVAILTLLIVTALASEFDAPSFNVDINASPEQRWSEIIKFKREQIRKYVPEIPKRYYHSDPTIFNKLADTIISRNLLPEFQKEVHAISRLADIPYRMALLTNLVYEIFAIGCTSLIARDANGRPWLGRNLDYMMPEALSSLIVKINWMDEGKIVFISEHFAGMVGVTTGMKPGAFAISINERTATKLEANIAHILNRDYESPMITISRVLKTAGNYEQALNMLSTAKIMAPCYFQIAGVKPDEGAILVRDYDEVIDKTTLADDPNAWFIVQTNSDRNRSCARKNKAIEMLNQYGKDVLTGTDLVDKVLAISPTKNSGTMFSVAYCPATNDRSMHIWYL